MTQPPSFPYDAPAVEEMAARVTKTVVDLHDNEGISYEAAATIVLTAVTHISNLINTSLAMASLGLAPEEEDAA